ncbi:MAG TPA: transglycosylase SLT domain-containing protein [Vicinamibacterales bacterium]|nr:transglycosylase SLT domain-containing protein [Vicinamibacterales bacterium]
MSVRPLIEAVARGAGLDPDLVDAVVRKESSGVTWAWNPEPHYRFLWDVKQQKPFRRLTPEEIKSETPPADFPCLAGDRDQEWWAQQASWGLMQVMGGVAREQGFRGGYINQLHDPEVGLFYGVRVLRALILWADGNLHQALAAYNGGRGGWTAEQPQRYATSVLQILERIRKERR